MNYILIPYLEDMALVKIVTRFWNQDDVRISTANFNLDEVEKLNRWKEIEDRVIEKGIQLPLPPPLKEKLSHFIKLIGMEILKWIEYHGQRNYLSVSLPNNLRWTSQGTVDNRKTAELLIKDEGLDITSRYNLACIYCLENDIPELWNKIPENERQYYCSEEHPLNVQHNGLVVFWTYDIKEEMDRMSNFMVSNWLHFNTPYQYIFEYAAASANKVATEYFLPKLTPEEREMSLVRSTGTIRDGLNYFFDGKFQSLPEEYHTEVLYFLLSQMREEQLAELLGERDYDVLNRFLNWPWQSLFIEIAECLLAYLSDEYCNDLLRNMADKMIDGYKDYHYEELFETFWKTLRTSHKTHVRNNFYNSDWKEPLSSKLRRIDKQKLIDLILK